MAKSKAAKPAAAPAKDALKAKTQQSKVTKEDNSKKGGSMADFEEFPSSEDEEEQEDYHSSGNEDEGEEDAYESTDDEQEDAEAKAKPAPKVEKETKQKFDQHVTQNKKGEQEDDSKPRVVYVGRIPHGFYEQQMKAYFSQFGEIKRLRLSRNKKTGKSKHYAFIEFANHWAADAVADVMNGYLLFGHILQVRLLSKEQIHEDLWIGSDKTFKPVPWKRVSKHHHDKAKPQEKWDKLQEKHESKIKSKNERLKELGIDYQYSNETPKKKNAKKASSPAAAAQQPEKPTRKSKRVKKSAK